MTVLEYEYKFNELSRYPKLVPNKEDKYKRFEGGLWNEIQTVAIAVTYPSVRALA